MKLKPVAAALAGAVLFGGMMMSAPGSGVLSSAAIAADASKPALTPGQEDAIRKLVKEYLLKSPEVILEALQDLRRRQQLAKEKEAREALVKRRDEVPHCREFSGYTRATGWSFLSGCHHGGIALSHL